MPKVWAQTSGHSLKNEIIIDEAQAKALLTAEHYPISPLVRALSFDDPFGFQFGKVLFDGFGGYSDHLSEFPGRIVGVIFEKLEDFLPTFLFFLPYWTGFLPTVIHRPAIFRAVSIDIKRFVFFAIFLYLCLKHLPGEPFVKGLCGCLNGNDGSTIDEYAHYPWQNQ